MFNPFGGGQNPFGNMMNFMQMFGQFGKGFQGNPQQSIQKLLNSGKMTQEQYNQCSQMANNVMQNKELVSQLMRMLGGRF